MWNIANTWLLCVGLKTLPFPLIQPNSSDLCVLLLKSHQLPLWLTLSGLGRLRQGWSRAVRTRSLLEGIAVLEASEKVFVVYTRRAWEAQGLMHWQVVRVASVGDLRFSCTFPPPPPSLTACFSVSSLLWGIWISASWWDFCAGTAFGAVGSLAVPEAPWCSDYIDSKNNNV